MSELLALLNFGGYTALLLWGVYMVQNGVQRAFGARLGHIMGQALGTRTRAFFTGLGITAAIQSSTAAGLMITSFAAGGMVALMPALAAMLGANVGTTIIVQLLSFNLTALAPVFILYGVWSYRRHEPGPKRDLGPVFTGFGLLLLALHQLMLMFKPVQSAPAFFAILEALSNQPLMALILSAILTWAAHSSVTVVVLIMSMAGHNMVTPELAYALVLGANLGTAFNPVMEGGTPGDPSSRRLPIGNLGTRIVGCLIAFLLLPWIPSIMKWTTSDPSRAVANFHTLFNIVVALLFLPFLNQYANFINRMLPKRVDPDDPYRPMYLDESAHEVPAIALGNAARESLRLADMLQSLLGMVRASILNPVPQRIEQARHLASAASRIETLITTYLATSDQDNMNKSDRARMNDIMVFTNNVSRAIASASTGMLWRVTQVGQSGWEFDTKHRNSLLEVTDRLMRNQRRMAALFVAEDLGSARYLAYEKDFFRNLERQTANDHLLEIKAGKLGTPEVGAAYLDILRDAKTINTFMVEAASYPILARHNELLPNRLRDNDSAE